MAHCGRGDEYLVGQLAHTYRYEGGGAAVLGSIQPQPLAQDAAGQMALADIAAAIKPDDCHFARTRLLCLENTWNGHRMPMQYLAQATDLARDKGLRCHLDGARLFNAAVEQAVVGAQVSEVNTVVAPVEYAQAAISFEATVIEARRIVSHFDSVSVCFSKGLGAPIGSALCGSKELIARAHRIRKMAGGGMRQAGFLAAAASHALDHHIGRLADDHQTAKQLAQGLAGIDGVRVKSVQTNIVFVDVDHGRGPQLLEYLKAHGVLATGLIGLRFVTHLDVDAAGIGRTLECIRGFFGQQATGPGVATANGVY
jgi:threonine aldolase